MTHRRNMVSINADCPVEEIVSSGRLYTRCGLAGD
jgi:hypothetical protein